MPATESPSACRYSRLRAIPARRQATEASWPSTRQRHHDCAQRRCVNRARDSHRRPGRELDLDRTAGPGGRRQRLPVRRNADRRKTDFVSPPLHRPRFESENPCACLPPPGRDQIAVNIMSASNLDNTSPRRQTLLHDPKLLGSGPPPSPLWTGQNRNRRHICSFVCKSMSKSSHPQARSGRRPSPGLTEKRLVVFAFRR